jgi:hypothetical protein
VRNRLPLLLGMAALLLLALLVARGESAIGPGAAPTSAPPPTASSSTPIQPGISKLPDTDLNGITGFGFAALIVLAICGAALVIAALLALLARLRRRGRHSFGVPIEIPGDQQTEEPAGGGELHRGVRSALAELRAPSGGPPADAVQRAWLRLEEAAEATGTGRRPDQTATEFTVALLAAEDVDESAVRTLRELYQRARFAEAHTVTDSDARAAEQALRTIARQLGEGR